MFKRDFSKKIAERKINNLETPQNNINFTYNLNELPFKKIQTNLITKYTWEKYLNAFIGKNNPRTIPFKNTFKNPK